MVAAQWDVDDEATARLMSDLYARLATGTPLARALAEAQAARAMAGEHPIDWAGFAVLGGPRLLDDRSGRLSEDSREPGHVPDVVPNVKSHRTSFTGTEPVAILQVPHNYPEVALSVRATVPLHSLEQRRHR